jgi:hypothetical protein
MPSRCAPAVSIGQIAEQKTAKDDACRTPIDADAMGVVVKSRAASERNIAHIGAIQQKAASPSVGLCTLLCRSPAIIEERNVTVRNIPIYCTARITDTVCEPKVAVPAAASGDQAPANSV